MFLKEVNISHSSPTAKASDERNCYPRAHTKAHYAAEYQNSIKSLPLDEDFAEIWLDSKWVKVEILRRNGISDGVYLVERLDGSGVSWLDGARLMRRAGIKLKNV